MEDRAAIFDYIEAESPRAAIDVDAQIGNQLNLLIQHPKTRSRRPSCRNARSRDRPYAVSAGIFD